MRFVIHLLLMIAVALGTGFGLSWHALNDGRLFGGAQVGPWSAWPDVGSGQPNPYTRAHLARAASLQLGLSEGIQFTATTDSAGEPLTRNCTYHLNGTTPLATFWTLYAVDSDGINIAAPDDQAAIRSDSLARANDGAITLNVGTSLMPGNWLELTGTGPFGLVLTLYDTTVFSGLNGSTNNMPAIEREDCA
ncbi:Hypothetical protein precursor [Devosia sp. LC5]|uniref:DUF1214 domain-containing protein n=1 Tax=Devosia sp. LC5 TaxID=1502724 RepID=UPI0004E3F256|nr:DUF1214 domain-containing protein [Devosia sp. LC5]KFC65049.1 Hypothetical protein precursor [Devosia sp. LC5]